MTDIPDHTTHQKRAMLYIRQVNQELDQEKPANISTLAEESDWNQRYFTRAWKALEPQNLVERTVDGVSTRLSLTDKGHKVLDLYLEINEVMEE